MKITFPILAAAVLVSACDPKPEQASVGPYPVTRKVDTVDTYFGTAVKDPYRWLENDTTRETAGWVASQNEVTFGYLKNISFRDAIRKRLDDLQNYERLTAPRRQGEYYYYTRNSGLQNQNVHYRRKGLDGPEEVFIDPNALSSDGTIGVSGLTFSRDGSLLAYQVSEGGSDWRKVVIIRAQDKTQVGDTLRWMKFPGVAWRGNDGFYYNRFEIPKGSILSSENKQERLFYHKLGTPQRDDLLVFDGGKSPKRFIGGGLTEDERFLIIYAANDGSGNELYVQDLSKPGSKLVQVVGNLENSHSVIENDGDRLIIQTNLGAPNYRIVVTDISNPGPSNWKDLIPESTMAIDFVSTANKRLFVGYLKDASTLVRQFDYQGKTERDVELPGIGSAGGFSGRVDESQVYYSYTSFTTPTSIFRYDISLGTSTLYAQPNVKFDPSAFETSQVFFTSKDGTKVPMFVVHKKGLAKNGKNPTLLYGYGGFNISETPAFSTSRIVWLENGGVFALPNIRGGGEYGEKWHDGGRQLNKQNVFDDFIAAGEYLIQEGYTSSAYLAISGGSNGGLLVGAVMTQRPDLAKVALPAVGVMDMLRYHKFTVGAGWAYDYGTSEDSKEMFEYLLKYSPLHALKPGTAYPATLITTADHDDRVVPAHSFKFAATLQEHHKGTNPVLIRIDTKSGHSSSNLSKALDAAADQYAFTWYNMGIIPPMVKKDM